MKKILSVSLLIITVILSIFFLVKNKNKEIKFVTEKISRGTIIEAVTASGTVNPVINISVGTQVSGTIKKLYVDFNSPVKKGQLLAEIDPSLFEAQVEQGSANLYSAQANLQRIQSIAANDLKTYNRNKILFEKNFIAKSEVDLAESVYFADKAQIASARAQIVQASASLRNNLTNLRYTKIISPVNGIVVSRNVDVGQTVAASFQTPTLFLVAQDLTKMQIDTNVAEADIGKVKENQKVEYNLDGYPDLTFTGFVKQIRIAPTTVQNVVTYDVVVNVDNKDYKLKPGMTANVSIITAEKSNILVVPSSALRFTPYEKQDSPKFKEQGIWILKNEEPTRIKVTTGISDGGNIEIISADNLENENLITGLSQKSKRTKGENQSPPRMRMF